MKTKPPLSKESVSVDKMEEIDRKRKEHLQNLRKLASNGHGARRRIGAQLSEMKRKKLINQAEYDFVLGIETIETAKIETAKEAPQGASGDKV